MASVSERAQGSLWGTVGVFGAQWVSVGLSGGQWRSVGLSGGQWAMYIHPMETLFTFIEIRSQKQTNLSIHVLTSVYQKRYMDKMEH